MGLWRCELTYGSSIVGFCNEGRVKLSEFDVVWRNRCYLLRGLFKWKFSRGYFEISVRVWCFLEGLIHVSG